MIHTPWYSAFSHSQSARPRDLVLTIALVAMTVPAMAADLGETSDLEIGGTGTAPGQFLGLNDMVFDAHDRLYVLDGSRYYDERVNKELPGNARVQIFSDNGTFLTAIPVALADSPDKDRSTRMAVDSRCHVFITQPTAGVVVEYAPPDGFAAGGAVSATAAWPVAHTFTINDAFAVASGPIDGKERIAVVARKNDRDQVSQVSVIDPATATVSAITIDHPVTDVAAVKIDTKGVIRIVAALNQVYSFDSHGHGLGILGAGTQKMAMDASELQHTLAFDSGGRMYGMTPGNPGMVARFTTDFSSVDLMEGQFRFANAWGPMSHYVVFAIDSKDRLYVASTGNCVTAEDPQQHHYRPCILRTKADFFSHGRTAKTRVLGLDAAIAVKDLESNIAYDLKPISADYVLKAAIRRVQDLTLTWHVYDIDKKEVATGGGPLATEDGKEAHAAITFTPPAYGWYEIEAQIADKDGFLMAVAEHIGVTKVFPGMAVIEKGAAINNWNDEARVAFSGMKLDRTNTRMGHDWIEKQIAATQKYGVNLLLQFEGKDDCSDDKVKEVVTAYKGRIRYYEIVNEPNFTMSPQEYSDLAKRVVPIIRGIDPDARIMGPDTCGINLGYMEEVFKSGAADLFDIISIHDYEGNEAITPVHWRERFASIHELMAKYKLKTSEIWQTERAISATRAGVNTTGVQAVRLTLHRDLLETLGVPNEHDYHYYIDEVGYSSVPSYLFCHNGPEAGALALRTRTAMVADRTYKEALDFGPDGNNIFMGLHYSGADGDTVILRQLGTNEPAKITLGVKGGNALTVVDSFGNQTEVPVSGGSATLTVPALPLYLRLDPGQAIAAPKIDFGPNLAKGADFSWSETAKGSFAILTNGVIEAGHPASATGDNWWGKMNGKPQNLEIDLPVERRIDRVAVYSMRADNQYCDLLDFDIQAYDGKAWKTLKEVRTHVPASDFARSSDSLANTWYMDQNMAIVEFPAVTTDRLRIVALRTTYGYQPDLLATTATGWKANEQTACLAEVGVYGPRPVALAVRVPDAVNAAVGPVVVTAKIDRTGSGTYAGTLKPVLPEGWICDPVQLAVTLDADHASQAASFTITPAQTTVAGTTRLRFDVRDAKGMLGDCALADLKCDPVVSIEVFPTRFQDDGTLVMRVKTYPKVKEDLHGTLHLVLGISGSSPVTMDQPIDLPAGKAENEYNFIPPNTDLKGKTLTATFTAHVEGCYDAVLTKTVSHVPYSIIGPFANDNGHAGFDVAYPPETRIDPDATYQTVDGPAKTVIAEPQYDGLLDLLHRFKTENDVLAYAATWIRSDSDQDAILSCGSDDGIKAWLNGTVVIGDDASRGAAPDQDRVRIHLKKGWNPLLLKITQGGGGWGFYMEVIAKTPQAQAALEYTALPPGASN